jgi:Protein of unknown function (DUF3303)
MLVMVIERYRDPGAATVYARAGEHGRMMPDGVRYVASWVDANLRRCFQVMECDQLAQLSMWIRQWSDLVDFEVVPVITSDEASALYR